MGDDRRLLDAQLLPGLAPGRRHPLSFGGPAGRVQPRELLQRHGRDRRPDELDRAAAGRPDRLPGRDRGPRDLRHRPRRDPARRGRRTGAAPPRRPERLPRPGHPDGDDRRGDGPRPDRAATWSSGPPCPSRELEAGGISLSREVLLRFEPESVEVVGERPAERRKALMIEYSDARRSSSPPRRPFRPNPSPWPQALGRTLARDVEARENIPPFTKATMDGYAVRAADTRRPGPGRGSRRARGPGGPARGPALARRPSAPGQAVRIMTGAPLPAGADAVVMVEDTEKRTARRVTVRREVRPGDNIGLAGEDLKKGEIALERGALIGPAEIGHAGRGRPGPRRRSTRRPRLAVIATGDEIVEPGERKQPRPDPELQRPGPHRPWPPRRAPRRFTSASPATSSSSLAAKLARAERRRHPRPLRAASRSAITTWSRTSSRRPGSGRSSGRSASSRASPSSSASRGRQLVFGLPGQSDERHGDVPPLRPAGHRPAARPDRARPGGRPGRPRRGRSSSSRGGPSSCAESLVGRRARSSRSPPIPTRRAASSGPWSGAASSSSSRPTSRGSKPAGRSRSSSWTGSEPWPSSATSTARARPGWWTSGPRP